MMQKRFMTVIGILVLASMVLAACTPAPVVQTVVVTEVVEGKTVEKVVTATPIPPTAAPPTAVPKAADTAVFALQQEPDTLHPLIGSMMARTIVNSAWQLGCMGQDETATWIPLGCESIPTLENGGAVFVGEGADKHLEVTYKIRADWRWTDGTPVTSADAVFLWKLTMDPNMEVASRTSIEKLYDVSAVDDKTVKAVFMSEAQAKQAAAGTLTGNVDFAAFKADYEESGYANQVGAVVDPVFWLIGLSGWLPSHVIGNIPAAEQAAIDWSKVPGDGAYYMKEWKQGQEIILEKSDKPFPLGDAKIKTLIFRTYPETAAVISALQNGEVDVVTGTGGLSVANAPDLDKIEAAGMYHALYEPGYQWEHIDLNTTKAPLDDVKVRKALYHAIDRQALVDRLYFGKQSTTDLPIPKGLSWAYTDNYTKYEFSTEKALALLAEAGWDCAALPCKKDGKNLEFTLMTTDRADRQALAQVIQSMWKKVNVGVNIQFLYGRGLFATADAGGPLSSRTFDAAIYTWITGDDPGHLGLYDCASIPSKDNNFSGQNYTGFCNKDADLALTNNETNMDIALSHELRYPELEKFYQIWTDQVPVIPLFSNTRVYVVRNGFKNFKAGPTQYAADAWNAWEFELEK